MKSAFSLLKHSAIRRKGALALEWILLITIVVVGVLGGLAAVRNATVQEITDLSKAVEQINVKTSAELASEGGS
ncbi:MAG: hypothetical protein ACR2FY_15470 [Pirellulaceae bacterium]